MDKEEMSDARIIALEVAQTQTQKDLSSLATKQTEMFNQQIQLDKTMSSILIKLDSRFDYEEQLEKTIRHLDDTVNILNLKFERSPIEHNRVITNATDKLWDSIRNQETKFQSFKEKANLEHINIAKNVKLEIKTESANKIKIFSVLFLIIASLVSAFYYDMRSDIKTNTNHIDDHHLKHSKN